jgi:hypothetical protein
MRGFFKKAPSKVPPVVPTPPLIRPFVPALASPPDSPRAFSARYDLKLEYYTRKTHVFNVGMTHHRVLWARHQLIRAHLRRGAPNNPTTERDHSHFKYVVTADPRAPR